MRILFLTRAHIGLGKGGLQMQIQKTAEALASRGVEVVCFDPWSNQIPEVDLCHVFSSCTHNYYHVDQAKLLGKPVVMSPVFGDAHRPLWKFRLMGRVAARIPGMIGDFRLLGQMLDSADAIIALNDEEKHRLLAAYRIAPKRICVIPNGVDQRFFSGDASLFEERYGVRDFILQVGSIDPNKNQLTSIQAMAGLAYRLVIIGGPLIGHQGYLNKCRAVAGRNVLFTGPIAFDSPLLPAAYAAAKAFVLPSISEVMPLCLYEAAAAGCDLLVSRNVPVESTIRDCVSSFNPNKPRDLARLIVACMGKKRVTDCKRHQHCVPTWQDVADSILDVYKSVLETAK